MTHNDIGDMMFRQAGVAQLVERYLAKVVVAGSNPVSRLLAISGWLLAIYFFGSNQSVA